MDAQAAAAALRHRDRSRRMKEVVRLTKEEMLAARGIWQEIFFEDSEQFTEYYFAEKMADNIGYGIKKNGELAAMLFRTPYEADIRIGALADENAFQRQLLSYIVGVGTRECYRHQGYMDRLLRHALIEMEKERQPFTFLMPADPAIYTPYQFRYIYDRPAYILHTEKMGARRLKTEEIPELSAFAQQTLQKRCQLFMHRSEAYYRRQQLESRAQNGDIYVWERAGRIEGFYLYAREQDADGIWREEIQEAVCSDRLLREGCMQESERKKPIIMARITNLVAMLSLLRLSQGERREILLTVADSLLPQNQGTFLWTLGYTESSLQRIEKPLIETECQLTVTIDELCEMIFGRRKLPESLEGLLPYSDILINEIV